MSDQKKTKRSAPISYRPPQDLRGELYARQLRSGLSMNAFISLSIFEKQMPRQCRRPPIEQGELARLLNHAAQIREQLDTIALDDDDEAASAAVLETVLEELIIIRAALLKAMGRQP